MKENRLRSEIIYLYFETLRSILAMSNKDIAKRLLSTEEQISDLNHTNNSLISDDMLFKLYYLGDSVYENASYSDMIKHTGKALSDVVLEEVFRRIEIT